MPDADVPATASTAPDPPDPAGLAPEPTPEPDPTLEPDPEPEPPPTHRLRAADPADQRRRDVAPAGQVLAVMVATLFLAAGLNSDAMLRSAEASPLGPGRDLAVGFWRPVHAVSSRIGLTGPRDGLDALRHLGGDNPDPDDSDDDGTELVAGLPSAPAGPTADQGLAPTATPSTAAATATGGVPAGAGGGPGTGLLGLDPTGLGGAGSGGGGGPLAGDDPQGPPAPGAATPSATSPTGTGPSNTGPTDTGPTGQPSVPGTQGVTSAGSGQKSPTADLLRRPTPADPLRVLLVGDSTMDAVGAAVLRELEPTGVTQATVDYKVSSGLARPDFFDWPAHLRAVRAASPVELVVIMMGANDAQPFMIDGRAEDFGTERWLAAYRERVASLLRELTANGGGVLWIGQPVMRKERFDADMREIDRIYAEEVANVPRARYLDSRPLLTDAKGAYATHLVDTAGDRQRVRQDDGIHLTEAGAERLAPAVVDAINALTPLY